MPPALSLLALVLASSIAVLNRGPLLYFDSAAYLDQGAKALHLTLQAQNGDRPDAPMASDPGPAKQSAVAAPSTASTKSDDTVVASRSLFYGLVIAALFGLVGLSGVVAMNLVLTWFAVGLLVRRVGQAALLYRGPTTTTAVALSAASLGSLPFYVAFVMPDILAPILILLIATLMAYPGQGSISQQATAVAVGLFAVLSHPTHLLLAAALVPAAVLLAPFGRRTKLRAGLLVGLVLIGGGIAERLAFGAMVRQATGREVVYAPFLTARLIDDGTGLRYLARRCPDPTYSTCALYETFVADPTPERHNAPNILFSTTAERGSLRLLPPAVQAAVARDQVQFSLDVVRSFPFEVAWSIAVNTAEQLLDFSVEMTIPTPSMVALMKQLSPMIPAFFDGGALTTERPAWAEALYGFHAMVYLMSLMTLAWLWFTGRLGRSDKAVVAIVLAGIGLNALICGAISEPAHRYGARVMFLLPLLAGLYSFTRISRT